MMLLRFSPAAWKKFHASLNTVPKPPIHALVEEYFHARGWALVRFKPIYGCLVPYRVKQLEVLLRPQGEKPWYEQPVYAIVVEWVGEDILASVLLVELPRNAEEPKPLESIAQSIVKRLSNVLRSLPAEHLNEEGSRTDAGACADLPLHPHGSGHEAGSRQDAPSQSPTGDCDGADSPPPQDGSPDAICANRGARATAVGCDNPALSGSDSEEDAWELPESCADGNTADTDEASVDATPSTEEASGGDEPLILPDEAGETPRESSTVPSAAVACEEDAAVRQTRRNILRQFARHANAPSKTACSAYGGQFASIRHTAPEPALVRQLRQIFMRLAQGGETEPSAHWDAARVALKTAGYLRSWTTHDRRLESGRPAILVLPDVSGSMGKFADEVTALASAVAELGVPGADILVVVHSNGYPIEFKLNRGKVQTVRVDDENVLAWYANIIRRYEVKLVLVAADWDGEWLYHWLAARPNIERLVWLDVYSSSYGEARVREFPPRWMDESDAAVWRPVAHKVCYADRCSTAADCIAALEMLIGG